MGILIAAFIRTSSRKEIEGSTYAQRAPPMMATGILTMLLEVLIVPELNGISAKLNGTDRGVVSGPPSRKVCRDIPNSEYMMVWLLFPHEVFQGI